ncbi:hypothetical protein ACL6C3_18035 [Capilliphycus salinus ALCB114379]|uniref:hypothetical protein n=1 Tax=Capilliphycus salinus TaxID=2768948 RepID=UPI0039A6C443
MAEHLNIESFKTESLQAENSRSTDSNRLETADFSPTPILPRSGWKSQLARTRALLRAKQALDREELQWDWD